MFRLLRAWKPGSPSWAAAAAYIDLLRNEVQNFVAFAVLQICRFALAAKRTKHCLPVTQMLLPCQLSGAGDLAFPKWGWPLCYANAATTPTTERHQRSTHSLTHSLAELTINWAAAAAATTLKWYANLWQAQRRDTFPGKRDDGMSGMSGCYPEAVAYCPNEIKVICCLCFSQVFKRNPNK